MNRRFLIPFFASFIAWRILGALIVQIFQLINNSRAISLAPPINIDLTMALGYIIPYFIIVGFGFSKYRSKRVELLAIVSGPLLLSAFLLLLLFVTFLVGLPPLF